MALPRVADGGDGLQIWRVADNILNKQSRTPDKGLSSSLGIGRRANCYTVKIQLATKCYTGPRNWTENWYVRRDLREIWWEGVDWIHLAQDRDRLWSLWIKFLRFHSFLLIYFGMQWVDKLYCIMYKLYRHSFVTTLCWRQINGCRRSVLFTFCRVDPNPHNNGTCYLRHTRDQQTQLLSMSLHLFPQPSSLYLAWFLILHEEWRPLSNCSHGRCVQHLNSIS
jgi:hypothetical protein